MTRSFKTGSVGIRTEAQYQYYIYVKREDIIGQRRCSDKYNG